MIGKVVGIKNQDFMGSNGPVKRQIYYLIVPGEDVQGHAVAETAHNLMNGPPPRHTVGEEMEVEYNEKGKLRIMQSAYFQHNPNVQSTVTAPTQQPSATAEAAPTQPRKAASA